MTSDCSRSASPMITCVYSISGGRSSSRSSSCAAPRMPPNGFLISWARLLISSRFACCCSSRRSSRAIFNCWSMWRNSSSSTASPTSTGETVHVRWSFGLPLTPSSISCSVYVAPPATALSIAPMRLAASAKICGGVVADQMLARKLEQVLGRGIRVNDRPRTVEEEHRRREHLQTRMRAPGLVAREGMQEPWFHVRKGRRPRAGRRVKGNAVTLAISAPGTTGAPRAAAVTCPRQAPSSAPRCSSRAH